MEQCFSSKVAVATFRFFYALTSVWLVLCTQSVYASLQHSERDYLLPGETRGGFIFTPSKTQSEPAGGQKQDTVNYRAFDGRSYILHPYAGRFVTVLLPVTPAGSVPLTADHIEEMVDRLDILYANYRDLMGAEPAGTGPLVLAFVPQTCGSGCGNIGSKGIEIRSDADNYDNIAEELSAGRFDSLLTHEMAHNFDLYWNYLHYLPDHGHAWTNMFEYFAPFRFARERHKLQPPDDMYQNPANSVWKPFIEDSSANWERCVRDQLCHSKGYTENNLWAMLYYRIETLHGIEAVVESFDYLKSYARSHAAPETTQEKEDLRLLSLAIGAHTNIACYLDTLKWNVSTALRNEMQVRFGGAGKFCADTDHDGYSAVEGDCDDNNGARNPGREEIKGNGIDDDCDDVRDEQSLVDSAASELPDFSAALLEKQLPVEVNAALSDLKDRDTVRFALPPNGRVEVKLCAREGFSGWVTALQTNGQYLQSEFWQLYLSVAGCSRKAFDFGSQTSGYLQVLADRSPGKYSLTISAAEDLPADLSQLLTVMPRKAGGMDIVIEDPEGRLAALGTDEVEFWISGQALRLSAPYPMQKTITLNTVSAPTLTPGSYYQARVRPLKNGLPLAGFSAGHLFRYDTMARTPTNLDDGYSGAWYDPSHSGEGFVVEVNENSQALVYWFTYGHGGEQRWMLGVGEVQGNAIVINELFSTSGGHFGDNFNPDDVVFEANGSLSIAFLDCNSAIANYRVDGIGDHQELARLSSVYGHPCGKTRPAPDTDLSGSWYDPAHGGEGFVVQQLSEENALVYWFSYTADGKQAWMFNTGLVENGDISIEPLLQATGGTFGRAFMPSSVSVGPWGNLELQLDCSGGTAIYGSDTTGFSSGNQQLVPLTRLWHSACAHY